MIRRKVITTTKVIIQREIEFQTVKTSTVAKAKEKARTVRRSNASSVEEKDISAPHVPRSSRRTILERTSTRTSSEREKGKEKIVRKEMEKMC